MAGTAEVGMAIARKFAGDNGLDYEPDRVIVSNGVKHFNAFMATVDPGDEVIVPAPYWMSYRPLRSCAVAAPSSFHARPAKTSSSSLVPLRRRSAHAPDGCY
jgi:aspartate/methionine/tyrosine aminotransferase